MPDLTSTIPTTQQTATVTQQSLPDWYNTFVQGLASRGLDIANLGYKPYDGQLVAGASPLQEASYAGVTPAANSYQPYMDAAGKTLTGALSTFNAGLPTANAFGTAGVDAAKTGAQGALDAYSQFGMAGANAAIGAATGANAAVAGPAMTWDDATMKKYMSPYTSAVVDEIGRLGNRNFKENLMPGVNTSFTSSGQFGSSRNAAILGNSMRDAQADISGLQSTALQSGYGKAAEIFGADANRVQAQGTNQADVALRGGTLASGALNTLASGLSTASINGGNSVAGANNNAGTLYSNNLNNQGALATTVAGKQAALGTSTQDAALKGINAQNTLGTQQQTTQQAGLDAALKQFQEATGFDMNQLNQLKSLMSGIQLPAGATTATNAPGESGASIMQWIQSILDGSAGNPTTPAPPATGPGSFGPAAPPKAHGGLVRRYARGGAVGALGRMNTLASR